MLNKRALASVLMLVVVLVAASPTLAGPPIRDTGFAILGVCGDFDLRLDWDVKVQETLEFDSENNLVGITAHYVGNYIYTNVENGKVVLGHEAKTVEVDLINEVVSQTGVVLTLRVPHEGVVLREVGRLIYNPFVGEPEDWILYFEAGSHPTFPDSTQIDAMICSLVAD